MYKLKLFIMVLFAIALAACSLMRNSSPPVTKQQVGTTADATSVSSVKTGIIPGGTIGQAMNTQDKINAQQALIATPLGQEAVWTNTNTKTSYIVKPVNEYHSGSAYCRQSQILVNNAKQAAYTTICKGSDGKWYVKQ